MGLCASKEAVLVQPPAENPVSKAAPAPVPQEDNRRNVVTPKEEPAQAEKQTEPSQTAKPAPNQQQSEAINSDVPVKPATSNPSATDVAPETKPEMRNAQTVIDDDQKVMLSSQSPESSQKYKAAVSSHTESKEDAVSAAEQPSAEAAGDESDADDAQPQVSRRKPSSQESSSDKPTESDVTKVDALAEEGGNGESMEASTGTNGAFRASKNVPGTGYLYISITAVDEGNQDQFLIKTLHASTNERLEMQASAADVQAHVPGADLESSAGRNAAFQQLVAKLAVQDGALQFAGAHSQESPAPSAPVADGRTTPVGKSGVLAQLSMKVDGEYVIVTVQQHMTYVHIAGYVPRETARLNVVIDTADLTMDPTQDGCKDLLAALTLKRDDSRVPCALSFTNDELVAAVCERGLHFKHVVRVGEESAVMHCTMVAEQAYVTVKFEATAKVAKGLFALEAVEKAAPFDWEVVDQDTRAAADLAESLAAALSVDTENEGQLVLA